MGFANRLMHETESFFGAVFDLVMGRGGDGVYGSSAENFYRPEEALTPVINIHTDAVNMHSNQAEREAAPLPEAARDINARDWDIEPTPQPAAPQREAAFYDAMRQQQESERDQQFFMSR